MSGFEVKTLEVLTNLHVLSIAQMTYPVKDQCSSHLFSRHLDRDSLEAGKVPAVERTDRLHTLGQQPGRVVGIDPVHVLLGVPGDAL